MAISRIPIIFHPFSFHYITKGEDNSWKR
jgi:hypothetical protein